MSIADKIQRLQTAKTAIANAIIAKGGTVNSGDGYEDFATDIGTIQTGGIQYIPRTVNNGKLEMPSGTYTLPSNVTDLGISILYYSFRNSSLTSANLSSLTAISGNSAMSHCFTTCNSLTTLDLSSLITVSGNYAMDNCFENCIALTTIDLSSLTTISGSSSMAWCFKGCRSLTTLDLSSLTTISGSSALMECFSVNNRDANSLTTVTFSALNTLTGSNALQSCFEYRTALTSVSFPALTSTSFGSNTNQFNDMLEGVTGCTVHFPSNLQSIIGSWADVTAGFGGVNTTILFDLSATS